MNTFRISCSDCNKYKQQDLRDINYQKHVSINNEELPSFIKEAKRKNLANKTIKEIDKENLEILSKWGKKSLIDKIKSWVKSII